MVHDVVNGLNGTLSSTGASLVAGGISSNAISLSRAANGFVSMGNVLPLTSGDFSLVTWVKMSPGDTTPNTMILGKHEGGSVNGYLLMVNQGGGGGQDNKAVFYAGGLVTDGPVSQTSVNDGNWHQVVGVYRSGVNKVIYVDGVAQATNVAPAINGNAAAFLVGGTQSSGVPVSGFTGLVDDVQVYNHALSPAEVLYLFQHPGVSIGPPPRTGGPVGHWSFNESGGSVAHDNTDGFHGNLSSSASFASGGISGNAISLNRAANGFVSMGNVLAMEGRDFSLVAWVKMNPGDTTPDTIILGKHESGSANGYLLMVNQGGGGGQDNKAVFYAGGLVVDGPVSKSSVNDGEWHQVVGVYKASVNKFIYVDGVAQATNIAPAINENTAAFIIGGLSLSGEPASRFTGWIDEVQVYDYALTPNEVLYLFQNPSLTLPAVLTILRHPTNQAVVVGGTVLLNVAAVGSNSLAYQWQFHGTNLPGATGPSLILTNAQFADAGPYAVLVSDGQDSLASSVAILTVNPPPPCVMPPAGLVSWWPGSGDAADISGGNNGVFFGASYSEGQVGQAFSFGGSGNYVRVPASPSLNLGVGGGLTVEAWINPADSLSGPIVEWAMNGVYAVLLWANTLNPGSLYGAVFGTDGGSRILQSPAGILQPGVFQHVAMTYDKPSGVARLMVNGAVVAESNLGTFTPRTASDLYIGYRPPTSPGGPVSFRGKIDEVSIYSRALAASEIEAIYEAGVSGKCVVPLAPFVIAHPQHQLVAEGGNATFSVAAGGTPPLSYQWSFNGLPVADATNASLSLTGVTTNQSGVYAVVVTNLHGVVESSNATLTVRVLGPHLFDDFDPDIDLMQWAGFGGLVLANNYGGFVSASNSLWFGGTGSRFVTTRPLNTANGALVQFHLRLANGNPPFWERVDLPGKGVVLEYSTNSGVNWTQLGRYDTTNYTNWTGVSLVIPPAAQAANTQFRWRQLLNSGASSDHWALDDVAVTTGPVAPFITAQPQSQTVTMGGAASFSVVATGTLPLHYQWWFNGTELIDGATGSSLTITNVQLAAAGLYSVVVSNAAGAVTSSNAVLTVNLPPTSVAAVSLSAEAGANVLLPIMLAGNGNENAVSFSLEFDPARLSYTGVTLGSGASGATLLLNTNQLGSGKLGIALALPADTAFPSGPGEIVLVGFTTAILTNPTVAAVSFGDVPISRLVSGTTGNVLASTFSGGTVSIAAANYEGDIMPRPDGDRVANITDWVLAGRYAARLDYPTNASEFQRADCAPRATLGDGAITVIDWVQTGRYAAALDPLTPVGGPTAEVGGAPVFQDSVRAAGGEDREIIVTNGMLLPNQTAAIAIQLRALGNENALGFSVAFDSTKLSYAGTSPGNGSAGATLNVNASQAGNGKLGFVMALGTGGSFAAGTHELLKLNFTAATAESSDAPVTLTDQPVPRQVSDAGASVLPSGYVNGTVAVHPLPLLSIGLTGEDLRLSWPLWASNYVLQQAAGPLDASLNWTNVEAAATAGDGLISLTQPVGEGASFYRLRRE